MAATERMRLYGNRCVVGDLVATVSSDLLDQMEACDVIEGTDAAEMVEDNDTSSSFSSSSTTTATPITAAATTSHSESDTFQRASKLQAGDIRPLTEEDIASGKFTTRDVVLPLVGSGIIFPKNQIEEYYKKLLANDGISMEHFSTAANQYRMHGAYRRLLQIPKDFDWQIIQYEDPNAELVTTELSLMRSSDGRSSATFKMPDSPGGAAHLVSGLPRKRVGAVNDDTTIVKGQGPIRAVVLNFTLSSGTYATMMLRELTKESTETQYQAQLTAQHAIAAGIDGNRDATEKDVTPAFKKTRVEGL